MDTLQQLHQVPHSEIHQVESSNIYLQNDRRRRPPQNQHLPWQRYSGGGGDLEPPEFKFTKEHYFDVLDSMGQAVHKYDLNFILIYWNRSAELLYGYSAAEALGCHVLHLLTDVKDHEAGFMIVTRVRDGEAWTGQFPATHKRGSKVLVYATISPFFDDNGTQVGIVTVTCDVGPFEAVWSASEGDAKCSETNSVFPRSRRIDLDPRQPVTLASRISNLASKLGNKMKSKLKKGEHAMRGSQSTECTSNASSNDMEGCNSCGSSTLSSLGVFPEVQPIEHPRKPSRIYGYETERKPRFNKVIASKAEAWILTSGILWSWKGSEHDDVKTTSLSSSFSHDDCDSDKSTGSGVEPETLVGDCSWPNNRKASQPGSEAWSSSSSSTVDNEVGPDIDDLDLRMLWENLALGQQFSQGTFIC